MIQDFHISSVSNKGNRHSTSKSEDLSKHTISSSMKHNLRHPLVILLHNIIESCAFLTVMSILTLYILFADDIKILTTDVSADIPFSIIDIVIMVLFAIELIISCIAVDDYFLIFFFWLDIISLLTILLDIHWFYNFFVNFLAGSSGKQTKSITSIVKAGKSAKVAARAVRMIRVLRIIRLVRVSKLYKAKVKLIKIEKEKMNEMKKENNMNKEENNDSSSDDEENNNIINKSKNSIKKDNNIQRVTLHSNLNVIVEEEIGFNFHSEADENKSPSVKLNKSTSKITEEKLNQSSSTTNEEIPKESKTGKKMIELDCSLIAKECDISITEMISKNERDNNQSLVKLSKFNKRKRRIKNMKLYKEEPVKNKVWKDFIADDEDFAFMRNSLDKKFYALYNEAFDEFQFGDWNKAKELFEQILDTNDDDSPSQYLYDILEQNNFERPLNWEGNKLIN